MKKTVSFFLDQHGCAKNQVDGELIISRLLDLGFEKAESAENADLIIINSCGFIESAKKESLDSLMAARNAYPKAKIVLAGCLAERYAELFREELPEADGVFGNGDISRIDEVVASVLKGKRPVVTPEQKGVCCGERKMLLNFNGSAFVKITEGCNNCCSFCAIPLIRGQLRSRTIQDITDEIKGLVKNGIHEINLIGQDLAAYGCGKTDDVTGKGTNGFSSLYTDLTKPLISRTREEAEQASPSYLSLLIRKISAIKGNFWVRLLYIHPDHFNSDILEEMKKDSRFLPYFDIPFQSGDDEIIRAMNRKGSASSYKKLVKTIRTAFPESAIRTTFLTGFPGETEENALNTRNFLSSIKSDWSGCFDYSREDDTPAAKFKGKVPSRTAKLRSQELQQIQADITEKLLRRRTGRIYDVLVEEVLLSPEGSDEGLAIGRTWFQAPEVDGSTVIRYDLDDKDAVKNIVPGAFVKVKVTSSSEVDVDGEYVGK